MPPKKIKVTCKNCGKEREIIKPFIMPEFCLSCHLANQKRVMGAIIQPKELGFVPHNNYNRD